MQVEIRVTKIDEMGVSTKSDKDGDLVSTISVKASVNPSDIARILNLIKQKSVLYCNIGSQQAELDLQMVEIKQSAPEKKTEQPVAEETTKQLADEQLEVPEQLPGENDPGVCRDCTSASTCDHSYFHAATDHDGLICEQKPLMSSIEAWQEIENKTDELRANEATVEDTGNGQQAAKRGRPRKATIL